MQAKDLRIDNYVSFNWSKERPTRVFRVRGISHHGTNSGVDDFKIHISDGRIAIPIVDYIDIQAIPLTADWLDKFSFEQSALEKDHETLSINGFEIENYWMGGKWDNFYFERQKGDYYLKLDFVHQLQNIHYSLTGTELELRK